MMPQIEYKVQRLIIFQSRGALSEKLCPFWVLLYPQHPKPFQIKYLQFLLVLR